MKKKKKYYTHLVKLSFDEKKWSIFTAKMSSFSFFKYMMQGCVRYGTYRDVTAVYTAGITGTGHLGKFGTASIPVPEISVSSVRHQYRYRKLR